MSFPLVHFHSHLFFYNKNKDLVLDLPSWDAGSSIKSEPKENAPVNISCPFANQSTPSTTQITCYNLAKADIQKIKKDYTVSWWAGWWNSDWTQNNMSHIFTSTINTVAPTQDNNGDWTTAFTCEDGQKFSNETALSKLYKSQSRSVRSDASGYSTALRVARVTGNRRITRWAKSHRATISQVKERARNEIARARKQNSENYSRWVHSHPESRRKANKAASKLAHDQHASVFHANIKKYQAELKAVEHSATRSGQRITRMTKRKRARLRTNIDAKREKSKRARSKKKSRSKKTKTSGLHFKKNTKASTIIKKLAKIGHIPISRMELIHDKTYTSGYTATKTPWQEIQNVVNDCNSNIWWPHGELYIGNFAQHKKLDFTLTPSTGLTQSPQPEDDDDSADNDDDSTTSKKEQKKIAEANPTKYDATSIFLPFLTTGADFNIQDPDTQLYGFNSDSINPGDIFSGEVVVLSGELDVESGNMPSSQFTFQRKSSLQKAQSIKNLDKAQKAARAKAAKDKRRRRRVHIKRARRTSRRVHRIRSRK